MEKKIEQWIAHNKKAEPYSYALFVIGFDSETDCPTDGKEYSHTIQSHFYDKLLKIYRNPGYIKLTKELFERKDEIENPILKRQIELAFKSLMRELRVPRKLLLSHMKDCMDASVVWQKARTTGDYKEFYPLFNKHIKYVYSYAKYNEWPNENPYDLLLDDFEENFTMEKYDLFFDRLKTEIVPLVNKCLKQPKKYNTKIKDVIIPVDIQRKIVEYMMQILFYTKDRGCLRETVHPFSHGIYNRDCRVTVNYHEDNFTSSIFSVLHEVGHALYNLNHRDELNFTNLFGGASFGMHESQSRFYENFIGRGRVFCETHYPTIQKIAQPYLDEFTVDDYYYFINDVTAQFSRIEADELTYTLHVLVRYELEKALLSKQIKPSQAKKFFADKMVEYLGIKPTNETVGVFQDSHYSAGAFGYFPTYALGSAYAAQIYARMRQDLNVDELISQNRIDVITDYLKEKIHQHGALLANDQIILGATNEAFNPQYFIDYLKEKYDS